MSSHILPYNHPDPPRLRHSQWGMVSLALSAAVGVGLGGFCLLLLGRGGQLIPGFNREALALGVVAVLFTTWLTAIVLALGALFERNTRRTLALVSLALCAGDVFVPLLVRWAFILWLRY